MTKPILLLGEKIAAQKLDDDSYIIGTFNVGASGGSGVDVIDVAFSNVTGSFATGTVIVPTQEIPNFFDEAGGCAFITGINMIDEDLQSAAIRILLMNANTNIGAAHAANSITDAEGETILARIEVVAADYYNYGNFSKVNYKFMDDELVSPGWIKAAAATRSLYIGIIAGAGNPTYTLAAGIKLKISVEYP